MHESRTGLLTPLWRSGIAAALLAAGIILMGASAGSAQSPAEQMLDLRAAVTRHLDMTYAPPAFKARDDWDNRRRQLRMQILVSAGLWPLPDKAPLNTRIFDRLERSGYSVEKVFFESYPGFFVTGNLYRPRGRKGPFPAVLSPHGHWPYGRLQNSEICSVPALGISLARQGYVVFTPDMVGYNDSRQVDHRFAGEREALWGFGSLGLHLWNCIRSVDFLESLEDVDRSRLGCTGASGGGTQTFLLTAVDDRIACSAPVNMVSAHMQGGDVCENAPGLRIDTNNMEIAATMAPRPMLMVSATGDWTKNTLEVEYPAVRRIYELYSSGDKVAAVRVQAEHNYNQESREHIYRWFARWLLGQASPETYREKDVSVPMPPELLVFYGRQAPDGTLTERQVADGFIQRAEAAIDRHKPRDPGSWEIFKSQFEPALRICLMAEEPRGEALNAREAEKVTGKAAAMTGMLISRTDKGDRIPAQLWSPLGKARVQAAVLLLSPEGAPPQQSGSRAEKLVQTLVSRGCKVLVPDLFNTGKAKFERESKYRYFSGYNRTDDANRIQDILTCLVHLRATSPGLPVRVIGLERAGLWALLARGLSSVSADYLADADQFDAARDDAYLKGLNVPGLRRAGDFRTAAALNLEGRLWIHNAAAGFPGEWIESVYRPLGKQNGLQIQRTRAGDEEIVSWILPESGKKK